jgi:hypothetical protein
MPLLRKTGNSGPSASWFTDHFLLLESWVFGWVMHFLRDIQKSRANSKTSQWNNDISHDVWFT